MFLAVCALGSLGAFLIRFQRDSEEWLGGIELPKSFQRREPMEAVDELNIALSLVLLHTAEKAYLEDLTNHGEFPLRYPRGEEHRLRAALIAAGRTEEEVTAILYGAR